MKRLLAAAAVAVIGVIALFSWWYWCPVHEVAMPPATATPRQVIETYVKALDQHDCSTASHLWAPDQRDIGAHWCHTTRSISARYPQGGTGIDGDQAWVSTVLTVRSRPFSNDHTLPITPFGWDYRLERRDEGWRIFGDGTG